MIKSNPFDLKPKSFWENTMLFAEELWKCLLLLDKQVGLYDGWVPTELYLSHQRKYSGPQKRKDSKPESGSEEAFNVRDKSITLSVQIYYVLFLVSINQGVWGIAVLN